MDTKTITITAELTDAEALALAQSGTRETEREAQSAKPSDAWAAHNRAKNAPEH
jgi:hypothetical protein